MITSLPQPPLCWPPPSPLPSGPTHTPACPGVSEEPAGSLRSKLEKTFLEISHGITSLTDVVSCTRTGLSLYNQEMGASSFSGFCWLTPLAAGAIIHRLKDWAALAWVYPGMQRKFRVTDPSPESFTQFTQPGSLRMGTVPSQIPTEQGCMSRGLEPFGERPQVGHPRVPVFFWKERDASGNRRPAWPLPHVSYSVPGAIYPQGSLELDSP